MTHYPEFQGKVVLVTGAAGGVGSVAVALSASSASAWAIGTAATAARHEDAAVTGELDACFAGETSWCTKDREQAIIDRHAIGTDDFADAFHIMAMRNQFVSRRHINTIHIGETNFRRGRGEIHFLGTHIPCHLDNLLASCAAHN